jgi:hypothetical protein
MGCWQYIIKSKEVKEWPDYIAKGFLKTWPNCVVTFQGTEEQKINNLVIVPDIEDIDDGTDDEEGDSL